MGCEISDAVTEKKNLICFELFQICLQMQSKPNRQLICDSQSNKTLLRVLLFMYLVQSLIKMKFTIYYQSETIKL